MKFNVKCLFDVTGQFDMEVEADSVDDLREAIDDQIEEDNGVAEIIWDTTREYRQFRVTLAESGHEVILPAEAEEPAPPTDEDVMQALATTFPGMMKNIEEPGAYLVDVPESSDIGTERSEEVWRNMATFKTKAEAVAWIRENVGPCDDDGNISLITYCPDHAEAANASNG